MTAVAAHWDPATDELVVANCGHVAPVVLRGNGAVERLEFEPGHGLGGRATPKPVRRSTALASGDRLVMVSDGVVRCGRGQAGLGFDGVIAAAAGAERATAAETVRELHRAVLSASGGDLEDDATAVCLAVS